MSALVQPEGIALAGVAEVPPELDDDELLVLVLLEMLAPDVLAEAGSVVAWSAPMLKA
jgi:hypothetical protein